MNKIVCDLCGASYPETAPQCPICGTAKSGAAKSTSGSETGYAYVKGGRFSHANVRKRNAGNKELPRVVAPVKPQKPAPQPKAEVERRTVDTRTPQQINVSKYDEKYDKGLFMPACKEPMQEFRESEYAHNRSDHEYA